MLTHPRFVFGLSALICAALLGYGYYLQYHEGLDPCPMCIFQRLCFMAIALCGVLGALHGPRGRGVMVYGFLIGLASFTGAGIAARQVWLQHLPEDQIPACGPGLEYMLDMYPLADVIRKALRGTGECAAVDWTFLGASIAEWSLLWFVFFILAYATYMIHHGRRARTAPAA